MLNNYLKIAFRNLSKHKGYSLINICGLAIGITCCSLILLYVQDELNFDRFHKKSARIFRVVEKRHSPDMGIRHIAMTAPPVAPAMVSEFPEVIDAVRLIRPGRFTVEYNQRRFYEGEYFFSDPNIFTLFDFKMLKGDPQTALLEPRSVVITEKAASKYFGNDDPFGKHLIISGEEEYKVTGILQNPPHNSHLDFSMLFSFSTIEANERWRKHLEDWSLDFFHVYVLLNDRQAAASLAAKLPGFTRKHRGEAAAEMRQLYLQPLTDIHFHSAHIEFEQNRSEGDISYIYIFTAIAMLIAVVAGINYMNLATARSMSRAREVGLRKVVGARRSQLIRQFMSEALLITLLALVLAGALVQMSIPIFNDLAGKSLSIDLTTTPGILLSIGAIALVVGFFSGSYPALYLSKLHPASMLKGQQKSGRKAASLRHGLVVAQFVLSIIMITATVVVVNQLHYLRNKRLGFNESHLVVVDINSGGVRSNFRAMMNEFAGCPGVKAVTVSSRVPGEWKDLTEAEVNLPGLPDEEVFTMTFIGIEEDFLQTYEMELLEGRNFSGDSPADSLSVLLNETAVRVLGLNSAVGKRIRIPAADFEPQVIGVVKDFHFRSLHDPIGPLVLGYWSNPVRVIDYFTLRVDAEQLPVTLAAMEAVHKQFDQITPFEYNFLDDKLNRYYQADIRLSKLFGIAAALAIFIACLGLFGLAAYAAEQRTKEIGIRKVLGASVTKIVLLLSKDFAKLVLIAFIISAPIAYYLMGKWLESFAYRIEIGFGTFLLTASLSIVIALLTVSYQAIKAGLTKPVNALRYE